MTAVGIILIIVGLFGLIYPKAVWFFKYGLAFRDAYPSGFSLILIRIVGVVCILVGIAFLAGLIGGSNSTVTIS